MRRILQALLVGAQVIFLPPVAVACMLAVAIGVGVAGLQFGLPVGPGTMLFAFVAFFGIAAASWGILTWLLREQLTDPVFGTLYRDSDGDGGWDGWFDADRKIGLGVAAGEGGPGEDQRQLYVSFKERFDELRPTIETALLEEYQACRNGQRAAYEKHGGELLQHFDEDFPPVQSPAEIWNIAHLAGVSIRKDDSYDVALMYVIDWADGDHVLTVLIQDWKVIAVQQEG